MENKNEQVWWDSLSNNVKTCIKNTLFNGRKSFDLSEAYSKFSVTIK